ncbi:FAD dependent oxidoreductase-domain-containing protein [Jimgerdemannia flammicorona]|uniref:FAD-dependent oxidoreductase domain-containing protein 1 n=2 Tax=Jimgerdemannia flammicorona TaxID=994334 RepID=A0A433QRW9_9FUNG|nr:FAD dependent oxidoreductase-domain-containing protein [Jimgerdemannia flammicorona]RUS32508.1 FAD dependent oxidoreductase-domain-containing protein [Jimgerdemannia flammicorona]
MNHNDHIDITIIGGGLAGLNCAYALHKRLPNKNITVLERGDRVMGLTSSASTGGFRNFFPNSRAMTNLSNRSIDLLLEYARASAGTGNEFMMNRCGYVFLSAQPEQMERYKKQAQAAHEFGSVPSILRWHSGAIRYNGHPYNPEKPAAVFSSVGFDFELYKTHKDGLDLIDDPAVIRKLVPDSVTKDVRVMFHVRKAGYLDVEGLGTCHREELMR